MQNFIPDLAECLVEDGGITSPPVDLFKIMEQEKLLSIGNDYGRAFDGRIEWNGKNFYIYYNTKYGDRDHPRVRFSIAHELGHYAIPAHRKILQTSPEGHPSNSHYIYEEGIEWEADAFAAYLLMPNFLFKPTLREIPDLGTLIQRAALFNTSLLSTVVRYVEATDFACLMFVSDGRRVRWHRRSESFVRLLRATGIKKESTLSKTSCTFRLASKETAPPANKPYVEGPIISGEWFDYFQRKEEILEQVMEIGSYGYLTLLCVEEPE